ncbi:c-type cytochrome [Ramlibacter sp. AW1]|uniref:C-type cytochrome n=1 Tax=Ramlibacter aurantiacus TaxID=2801330 RepID=A0A936ZH83_9BURK|nr:c-type cytochrome [Ramlibacter aurantiacus]MBL0420867.1 c-type cytochrome [Ramlibacter aurantiacus]
MRHAFAVLTLGLTLAACDRADDDGGIRLRTDDAQVLALGERVYRQHCAACHGARLECQPNWRERDAAGRLPAPPHDAGGHTWHHPDAVLFDITKYGVARAARLKDYDSAMPAYEGVLSDAEIVAVLSWIKAQWPAPIRRQQEEVDRAARERR